jgi:hypothetical protein
MMDTITKPRTSRWRPGHSFEERRTNAWAAFIGFMLGRGYSTVAIAEKLDDGTTDATIRTMARKWDLPCWGKKSDGFLVIPMKERDRATITARAGQEGLGIEEYCRRFLVAGTRDRKTFGEVVHPDQFEDMSL